MGRKYKIICMESKKLSIDSELIEIIRKKDPELMDTILEKNKPVKPVTLNVQLDPELMKDIRDKAFKKYGHKRGYLKKATEEAFRDWLNKKGDPKVNVEFEDKETS